MLLIGAVALTGLALGFAAGFKVGRSRHQRTLPNPVEDKIPEPQSKEEFEADRSFYIDMYKEEMQQYDKLVPWAAGGALVLSASLLHNLLSMPRYLGLLGGSWVSLFVALATAIIGHFMSTRIYSSQRAMVEAQQARRDAEYRRHERIAKRSGQFVSWTNYISGGALLVGLGLLGVFAYLNF